MAKFKKSAKSSRPSRRATPGVQAQAERFSKTLSDSAQQIWLAGMGAFGRAQLEGTKLFEALVREGAKLEKGARRFTGDRADDMRDAVEQQVGKARDRAVDTWDKLEKVFEDRVQRALVRLGVPGRDDLSELSRKVDALTAQLRQGKRTTTARRAPAKAAPRKKAAAKTTRAKAATPKQPAKKATRSSAKSRTAAG